MPVRTDLLMGTFVTIDVVDERADDAAFDLAFGWFRAAEAICTRFDEASELMRLCAQPGRAVQVSDLLFEAVRFALAVAVETGGAFDPTVGGRMAARGFDREHRSGRRVRTPESPGDASYRDVGVDAERRTITLQRPVALDLGAVAKGLAVDAAARALRPFEHFAVDAGGDLFLSGRNHFGDPWSVGIRHPLREGELIETLRVSGRAVCTSGNYEKPHLIDPRRPAATAAAAGGAASVTVIAPNAMLADALATAAFVLGPREGVTLLERHGVDGVVYDDRLDRFATAGLPRG